jgi:1,4-alpha-glucan branching enzyme
MLENEWNKGMQDYVKELLSIYRKYPSLYELDDSWEALRYI